MKKFFLLLIMSAIIQPVLAGLHEERMIQQKVDNIGTRILNCNKIQKRVVFAYNQKAKDTWRNRNKTLTSRQIIVFDELYKSTQTDDEVAAMLAREIATVMKSYSGMWGGWIDSAQVALSSKKFETVADKRAVDYMVNAGYNPLALIVYINKTCPQRHQDVIARHNLTSKRLARIYEYITYKYPEYLHDNEYTNNEHYQNFLLTSVDNRRKLEEKIRTKSTDEVDYE